MHLIDTNKVKNKERIQLCELEESDNSGSSVFSKGHNSQSCNSPSFSDDEMTGTLSPFHLDSNSGFSLIESPLPSARTLEFVDRAIKSTVIGRLFGDESSLLNTGIDTTIREDQTEQIEDMPEINIEKTDFDSTPTNVAVNDKMSLFESPTIQIIELTTPTTKQTPTSQAFEICETEEIVITQMLSQEASNHVTDHDNQNQNQSGPEDFKVVRRDSDPLQMFKKSPGPQNRRAPSRKMRRSSGNTEESMEQQGDIKVAPNGPMPQNQISGIDISKSKECRVESDIYHEVKSRITFLDIGYATMNNCFNASSPTLPAKPFVPLLDFSTLHENVGGQDPILAQKTLSVSCHHVKIIPLMLNDDQDIDTENDVPLLLENTAKRKAGTFVDDEDLPPFSQVTQDQYKLHSHGSTDDKLTAKMKSQLKKIQVLKKKIRQFEEEYEKAHGFKPSHTEKATKPEIKKVMLEFSRARKEAKRLKEEAEMGSRSRHGSGTSSTEERLEPPDLPPTMTQTLDVVMKQLQEKRNESHRPEDIKLMNPDQVQDEKLAVQKALLHFEGIHGRPETKDEKELMRHLYDRYRTLNKLLSWQQVSPRGNPELQPVPEDGPIDGEAVFEIRKHIDPVQVPIAVTKNDEEDNVEPLRAFDFIVMRDSSQFKNQPVLIDDQGPYSPRARRKLELAEEVGSKIDSNLHQLPVSALQDELIKSRNAKKILCKTLRDFEESFNNRTGRKVGKEDTVPFQLQYNEHKQLKARIKLLEALLSKHQLPDV